ncbi:MAG: hypothetical protein JSV88_28665 [Candidatus Aminicenantes bacterium]|nr:MAG: hypothetical protein JSV88_28665 [Candidatus Aminicenantes bacterium]
MAYCHPDGFPGYGEFNGIAKQMIGNLSQQRMDSLYRHQGKYCQYGAPANNGITLPV